MPHSLKIEIQTKTNSHVVLNPIKINSLVAHHATYISHIAHHTTSQYQLGKHRSNALELVQKQPVIEVEGNMAVCDGGGGALGHPVEYIKLGPRADYEPGMSEEDGYPCIYCGLRYRSKGSGGGH